MSGGYAQIGSMALGFLSSMNQTESDANAQHDANVKNKQKHEQNKKIVAEMLGTLAERTSRAEYEINRSALRRKRSVIKAAYAAEGEATVRAARLGTGSGKRASLETFRGTSRVAGDLITDANIDLQTELTKVTEQLNDKAKVAIRNLNLSIPEMINKETSVLEDALGGLSTALGSGGGFDFGNPSTDNTGNDIDYMDTGSTDGYNSGGGFWGR